MQTATWVSKQLRRIKDVSEATWLRGRARIRPTSQSLQFRSVNGGASHAVNSALFTEHHHGHRVPEHRKPPALPMRGAFSSHLSASVAMAAFIGGSACLAVIPELPGAKGILAKPHAGSFTIALTKETPPVVTASLSGGAGDLLINALHPGVVDDLTLAEAAPQTRTIVARSGDTLTGLLVEAGANPAEAYDAVQSLKGMFNPRKIRAGQEIEITLAPTAPGDAASALIPDDDPDAPDSRLLGFRMQPTLAQYLEVNRQDSGSFHASAIEKKLTETPMRVRATIDSSLFLSAADLGVPNEVIVDLIRLYSYDVDFQREIQKGDSFEVLFTRMMDPDGQAVKEGHILYAALTTGGKTRKLWRFTTAEDSVADYYDETGRSAKKFLMRTPIDGARLSSGFGMRMHPVLGYSKMHKGVDFAAPTGTPVMAAGGGVIEFAARNGAYGNYVRLRHSNGYKTAYGHLNAFAAGIRKGQKVQQGQIIGFVGTTGRSTGAHLHYEVLADSSQVNPMSVKVPTGSNLQGRDLTAFQTSRSAIDQEFAKANDLGKLTTAGLVTPSNTVRQ